MSKAFVLFSGGIDSAVCLEKAVDNYDDIEAIHFSYGQQTEDIEFRNAQKQADSHGIPLHRSDYRQAFQDFAEGTIEDKEYDRDQTTIEGHSVGFVPQRNLHFLVSTAAIAEHNTTAGEDIVLIHGAQNNDEEDYPDCRPEFFESAERAINRSTDQHEIAIRTPIISLSKEEVIELGSDLGVDWELTFSCYNDKKGDPCGECPACIERQEAFQEVGIGDPVTKP